MDKQFDEVVASRMLAMLYCAAANSDTEIDGRDELRRRMDPVLAQYEKDHDAVSVVDAVKGAMPDGWKPTGEFGEKIVTLETKWPTILQR